MRRATLIAAPVTVKGPTLATALTGAIAVPVSGGSLAAVVPVPVERAALTPALVPRTVRRPTVT
ncbi:MAG TPA: hypothetical protein VLH10_14230, partial [Yinghuangia sp.]|nr:hypothetical protein [Yinghuangia sp.]